jgi:hypothetical protein
LETISERKRIAMWCVACSIELVPFCIQTTLDPPCLLLDGHQKLLPRGQSGRAWTWPLISM